MTRLEVRGLHKRCGGLHALGGAAFPVNGSERIGLRSRAEASR